MKINVACFLSLVVVGALIVGCGSDQPRNSTEGASAQDIADYEAAVAAAEGSMDASADSSAENPPTAGQ